MVIGSFGKLLTFEASPNRVFSPRDLNRVNKGRYEEHKVLGAKPRLEFLSPELQVFSLSVTLSAAHGVDPFDSLLSIKALVTAGIAERLILGGINYGWHVIENSSEKWKHSLPDGRLLSAVVALSFKEYVK